MRIIMKALVTGGTGFLGSHIVEELIKKGVAVKCLVRNLKQMRWLKGLPVEIVRNDCYDRVSLSSVVSDVDYVFHAAGLVRAADTDELYRGNVLTTRNLAEIVLEKNKKLKKFVYVSSQAAAGPAPASGAIDEESPAAPVSHYGFSKLLAEREVLNLKDKMPVTIVRPPSIYGPRDRDVFLFFKYVKNGIFPLPREEKRINISYVTDVSDGILLAAESDLSLGKTYFIGDDKVVAWEELARTLISAVNPSARIIKLPEFIFQLSAFSGGVSQWFTGKPAVVSPDKLKEIQQKDWLFSSARARSELGYSPKVSLAAGVKATYDWYRSNGWL
jgi:nucleoside-diphosphate-sugar epimerase